MNESTEQSSTVQKVTLIRGVAGGTLMGLANLVPGISGGTMLLASGIYTAFINAIAEVTTLKFRLRSIIVLASVVGSAALAILLLAGTVKDLVVHHRWLMYSLFIGLTLGGIPVLWKMIRVHSRQMWVGAVFGFIAMAALAWMQQTGLGEGGSGAAGWFMLFLAGAAGASAMILPGVSGGYLLLVLGQYVPILAGIDRFKEALKAREMGAAFDEAIGLGLPVGLGVVIGVVAVSNLLRWCLRKFERATLGVLLGLLLGAVVGLWPFQQAIPPQPGEVIKGQVQTSESLQELDPDDYPTEFFSPSVGHMGGALGMIALGLSVTFAVSRIGGKEE